MQQRKIIKKILKKTGLVVVALWLMRTFSIENMHLFVKGWISYVFNAWISNFPNHGIRIFYLRYMLGIKVGKETFVHMGCFFEGKNINIGNNTVIGRNCYLGGSGGKLIIKNNVSITAQTYIFCSTHDANSPDFKCISKDVTIEDNVWIGARAMVLPGVKVGKGAILGAMSIATKNIPDYCIYAGNPACEIGKRNNKLDYKLRYFPYFQ